MQYPWIHLTDKSLAHLSEQKSQLTNTLENIGYSAAGSFASQLGGESSF